MNRRTFLTSTTAGAAGVAALGIGGAAQAPAPAAGQGREGGRGRGTLTGAQQLGNPGTPALVAPSKLARVSLMQLNFNAVLKPEPTERNPNPTTNPNQTLTIFDLPKVYVESYGVHNIEFQLDRVVKSETDPDFIKRLKAALDEYKMTMTQINMEIGAATGMTADAAGRREGIDRLKKWVDIAHQYRLQAAHAQPEPERLDEGEAGRRGRLHEGGRGRGAVERGDVLGRDAGRDVA